MAKANKSSRTVTFNATQAALRDNAQAFNAADNGTLADLAVSFATLFDASAFGMKVDAQVEEFANRRACWVNAYDSANEVVGGAKRFSEIFALTGLKKPQTAKAIAAQTARQLAKELAGEAIAEAKGEATAKDGAGAVAVVGAKLELSKIEAHIITLLRAGKFEMAAECIADMADTAAPF